MHPRHRIEICQYIRMTAPRARPEGCCPVQRVPALAKSQRDQLVGAFKALADPTRLELMRLLRGQRGPTCVCDLVEHFDLSQPTISHHLKVLREARLVRGSKVGIWSFYEPDPGASDVLRGVAELLD